MKHLQTTTIDANEAVARETANSYYEAYLGIVQKVMHRSAGLAGRSYHLFAYHADDDAERVIIMMGSDTETAHETSDTLTKKGEKEGVLKVRLYRPFEISSFISALPESVQSIAVLDQTKETGSTGEPLNRDIITVVREYTDQESSTFREILKIIGGRYGLSSKEFTPAMVKAVFNELKKAKPKNHFTIAIHEDLNHTRLPFNEEETEREQKTFEAVFFGMESDGTVNAHKNSIKIIEENTDNYVQGYFVYDSKKSGEISTSHLRFGEKPIRSTYLIQAVDFVAYHQRTFLDKFDILKYTREGATFLLNTPWPKDQVWNFLPHKIQQQIIKKDLKFYCIDANKVARESGVGDRINTIMQVCFFEISNIPDRETAILQIKEAIQKTYGKKGREIAELNYRAVDNALANLFEVEVPETDSGADTKTSDRSRRAVVPEKAPEFV